MVELPRLPRQQKRFREQTSCTLIYFCSAQAQFSTALCRTAPLELRRSCPLPLDWAAAFKKSRPDNAFPISNKQCDALAAKATGTAIDPPLAPLRQYSRRANRPFATAIYQILLNLVMYCPAKLQDAPSRPHHRRRRQAARQ